MKTTFPFKTVLLTAFFMVGLGLFSCGLIDSCDCPPVEEFFDVTGLISENQREPATGSTEVLQAGDTVAWEEYRMLNGFQVEYYGAAFPETTPGPAWNEGWMPVAYGCDCAWSGYSGSEEGLQSVTILLESPSLNGVEPQDTINHLFEVAYRTGVRTSVADFVTSNSTTIQEEEFTLVFPEDPEPIAPFSARIIVELGNGEVYEQIIPEVVLN